MFGTDENWQADKRTQAQADNYASVTVNVSGRMQKTVSPLFQRETVFCLFSFVDVAAICNGRQLQIITGSGMIAD